MRTAGSTALVTGATSGIGAAVARRLGACGARVLATGRDQHRLAALAADTGAVALAADLSGPDGVDALAARVRELTAPGPLDILVNNAGIGWAGPFARMPVDEIDHLIAVDLAAPLRLTRLLLPAMRAPASLIFVSSIAGRLGVRDEAAYAGVKAGLDVFATSLRHELAGSGIAVSVVVPGVVDTPFFTRRGTPYRRTRPRPVPADRVAAAVVTAIRSGHAEVYVPGWLRTPVAVRGALPGAYRAMARGLD